MKNLNVLPTTGLLVFYVSTCWAESSMATEVSLLGGVQFNADYVVDDGIAPESGRSGDDISVGNGPVFGVAIDLGVLPDPTDRIGIYLSQHSTEIGANAGLGDSDLLVTQLHFTGTKLYPAGDWEGFVTAGVGGTHFDPDDSSLRSSTEFSFQVGGGAQYKISEAFLFRIEARWIPIITSTDAAGICSGGCIIAVDSSVYSQVQINAGFSVRF
jgi:opacity protein-like surface antigen